jgi:hypothetical protein
VTGATSEKDDGYRYAQPILQIWDKRPHIPAWYERLLERRGYKEGLEDWFNPSYLSLMKEKGAEVQPKVKAIVALA